LIGLKEPNNLTGTKRRNPISKGNLRRLGAPYWWTVSVGAIFTLARFSEAFLVLRAQQSGVAMALVPLIMVMMNFVYSICAYPFGKLSDRLNHTSLLLFGLQLLIASDLLLAGNNGWIPLAIGIVLWGMHMGMTQGLLSTMVANAAPADLRGTAFGFFNLLSGLALLIASALAGWLWDQYGPAFTFYGSAVLASLAMLSLFIKQKSESPNGG
jgi:MFS family permease